MDDLVVYNISKWFQKRRFDGRLTSFMSHTTAQSERVEGNWAVKGVSFGVKKGERLVILGTANSGRSTILDVITGKSQR